MEMTLLNGLLIFAAGWVISILVFYSFSGPTTDGFAGDYHAAVTQAGNTETVAPGSAQEQAALDRWKALLANLAGKAVRCMRRPLACARPRN